MQPARPERSRHHPGRGDYRARSSGL